MINENQKTSRFLTQLSILIGIILSSTGLFLLYTKYRLRCAEYSNSGINYCEKFGQSGCIIDQAPIMCIEQNFLVSYILIFAGIALILIRLVQVKMKNK